MHRSIGTLVVALAPALLAACSDNNNVVIPITNGIVTILDQCDSVSFNAGLGPATCARAGTVTLAQFDSELVANKSVANWRFDPKTLMITAGGVITAMNQGGEVHTFTAVDQFGGGIVPSLNTATGSLVEAQQCKSITNADFIAPGGSYITGGPTMSVGEHRFQCCIHPWMRAVVTVTAP